MDLVKALTRPIVTLNKKGYNEVAYTRRGKDYEDSLGTNGKDGFRKLDTVWVTTKAGEKYEIPIDKKTGKIPEEYLFGRFLSETSGTRNGKRRNVAIDIGTDAETLHVIPKGGFTPEQIIQTGWWQHPNESDVEGIDDTGSASLARELSEAAKSAQHLGRKMVFIMPEDSAARAREIIAKDFRPAEIRKAIRNGGIIIKEGSPGRGADGSYVGRQEGLTLKTPVIILRPGWDEETLVHEFTHLVRQEDTTRGGIARTPMKLNILGERISSRSQSEKEFNSSRNLEEAATVAESYIRAREISGPTGYYTSTDVHGKDPYERSEYDRKLLAPAGPKKGKAAIRVLEQKFPETSISHMGRYRPGTNAINYYNERKAAGTLPKAEKPLKPIKRKEPAVAGGAFGPGGVVAASANRSRYRPRR